MDLRYLSLALAEAEVRRGSTCPNPPVGAVLVRGMEVVGAGHHWGAGFPHAEVVAVESAGEKARGATLYVTLEPCCHWGRTPPCTGLIREKGISRVIFGFRDPNPKVSGGGEAELRRAGIAVERVSTPEIDAFYGPYAHWVRTGRPFVTAKLAMSLDGRISGPGGRPLRLTGAQTGERTHRARRAADFLLTSLRTMTADDPRLDARIGERTYPKRVGVLDRLAELPEDARLWSSAEKITVFHGSDAPADRLDRLRLRGAELVGVSPREGRLDLDEVLAKIGIQGFHSLWVEAGGRVFQSLVSAGLADRAWVYVAPVALGEGIRAFEGAEAALAKATSVVWSSAGVDVVGEFSFAR